MEDHDLHRRVSAVEQQVHKMQTALARLIATNEHQTEAIDTILDWVKWGVRLILGGIVLGIIGYIFKGHV